jgi:ATP-binding cassette subfamily B protein
MLASIALTIVQGVLPVVSLFLIKLMVDAVAAAINNPDKGAAFQQVVVLIGIQGAVALLGIVLSSFSGLVREAQGMIVADRMQDLLNDKAVEADLEYYESSGYYDTMTRAQEDAPQRPMLILGSLASMGQNSITLVSVAALLLTFNWGITVLLFAAALPAFWVRVRFSRIIYRWIRQYTPEQRKIDYLDWLLTRDIHAKEIRLFGLGNLLTRQSHDLRADLRGKRIKLATRRSVETFGASAIALIVAFVGLALVGIRAVNGDLTIGDLVMFFEAFRRMQGSLNSVSSSISDLYDNNLFLNNLFEFLGLRRKIAEPDHPEALPEEMRQGIAFHQVSFQYPDSGRRSLDDISLTIRPGEKIALVGFNGSGKTTLIKLLCRLYDPTEGSITIDGTDLRAYATADLRRAISVVFQDYAKYQMTASENIWMGDIDRPADPAKIQATARESGANEVIERLPLGYDTPLGKLFDDGEELSIGEWQKVAIARALWRDSQIIILDEPTSALDPTAEFEVFERFQQLAANRTAIIISHRFSTVRMADRIYVLDDGKIAESGTHDQLMEKGGAYAHLFKTQAQYYQPTLAA